METQFDFPTYVFFKRIDFRYQLSVQFKSALYPWKMLAYADSRLSSQEA